ncbi:MAG: rod shape-determining protein MreC [Planctomycetes bacterium]|nr:rod shape-determining protein MreC [Planctomycetota bacterium]
MAQKQQVAGWYWIITAILTPFVLIATLVWAFYAQKVQSYRVEGAALVNKLEKDREQFEPIRSHMLDVSAWVGFKMGDPTGKASEVQAQVSRPSVFQGENERNAPAENQSPLLRAYLDAESRYYGATDGDTGYVHDYIAAREWLNDFENRLKGYVAFKGFQYYTVRTIEFAGGEGAVLTEGDLRRPIDKENPDLPAPEAAVADARGKWAGGAKPSDSMMQEPTRITLELIFRKQTQLLRDLVSANLHQYNLLYSDVAGNVKVLDENGREIDVVTGYKGEDASLKFITDELAKISRSIEDNKQSGLRELQEAEDVAGEADGATSSRGNTLQFMYVAAEGRIEVLQNEFQNAKVTHEGDAQKFEDLIRNLPRLKIPVKLEKSDPDGEISYSDYGRGITHINLGHADGVRAGQRFEVWRLHGFEKDEFVGVVEIVRALSPHFSLCTVLSLTNDDDPIRKGDKIVSQLWHDGKFLSIALHGSYEPPNEAYTKERLAEMLRLAGVKVVDKVQPGTDVVILGSNLLGDEWYRRARSDLRFETMREDDVRLYVDPR